MTDRPQVYVTKTEGKGGYGSPFANKEVFRVFEALDCLNIEKVQLNLVESLVDKSAPGFQVSHYIDMDLLKVLCLEILNETFTEYTEYKGTPEKKRDGTFIRPDQKPEARVLKIAYKEADAKGVAMKYPYSVSIQVGIGELLKDGAVKMVKAEKTVAMSFNKIEMKRFAITMLDYIRDFERYQREKLWDSKPTTKPVYKKA